MLTPPQITWEAHGSSVVDGCEDATGNCYVCCGRVTRGMPVRDWMGSNFTDQNRARNPTATHVCEACVYVHSRTSPVLGRPPKDGKKFGGNFRNYCHMWEDGIGYSNASKGEKPAVLAFIQRKHAGSWFCAVADSGQKHVLPFAPLNGPGAVGVVQFEETRVMVPFDTSLPTTISSLLTAGATKEEVERGDYRPATWQRCGDAVRLFERDHAAGRGSSWFALSLWLAQRNEEAVQERQAAEKVAAKAKKEKATSGRKAAGKARNTDGGGAARDAERVPRNRRSKRAEELGHPAKQDAVSSQDDRKPRGVGNEAPARPTDTKSYQQQLPGFG